MIGGRKLGDYLIQSLALYGTTVTVRLSGQYRNTESIQNFKLNILQWHIIFPKLITTNWKKDL